MTVSEFSNTFDTLLDSQKDIKGFGMTSSAGSISLDEYEKSILLTQAQDIVVKSFFDGTLNSARQGFDDSERRQIDFSELITVSSPVKLTGVASGTIGGITLHAAEAGSSGNLIRVKVESISELSNSVGIEANSASTVVMKLTSSVNASTLSSLISGNSAVSALISPNDISVGTISLNADGALLTGGLDTFDSRGNIFSMPQKVLFILNEKVRIGTSWCVVKPINYKEYDRLMTKPFGQPLKKEVWRLFQNSDSLETVSELVPRVDEVISEYKMRYIRRPRPIILASLASGEYSGGLQISGESNVSECELNPIIHYDILLKAVELAFNTRASVQPQQKESKES